MNKSALLDYAENELLYNQFMEPALRSAITTFAPTPGSVGLDVGCGPGGVLHLLDETTGHIGRITGIDISTAHLQNAREKILVRALHNRVNLAQVDLRQPLPFATGAFDWAWTADTLSSTLISDLFPDPVGVIQELIRVVKPGGKIAAFFGNWLGAMFMPGYAHIEQCICTAVEIRYRKQERAHPSFRHENALAWFRTAGLVNITITPHIVAYQQPLNPAITDYIQRYVFETEYKNPPGLKQVALGAGLTESDWDTWLSISDPHSPDYLLSRDDYFCVRYGILTTGEVPV